MGPLANIHIDLADRFIGTLSPEDCMDVLADTVAPYGYCRFHYTHATIAPDGQVETIVRLSRMGRAYEESWAADAHRMDDPFVFHCLREDRPKFWSELKDDYNRPEMTDAHRLKIDSIVDFGLTAGFTKRLRRFALGRSCYYSGISLVQSVGARAEDHDRAFQELSPYLGVVLEHFISSLDLARTARAHYDINDREYEVLGLLCEGLQVQQIADRMSLADRTAAHHLAALRRKLNAQSNAHAVAIAMKSQLI